MLRRPISTLTDTFLPYQALCRSTCLCGSGGFVGVVVGGFSGLVAAAAVAVAVVVATATLAAFGLVALLVLVLHDQRLLGVRLVAAHHQVAQPRVVEAEAFDELVEHGLVDLDVEQDVVGLDQVVDRIGKLAATPVLATVDLALAALDQQIGRAWGRERGCQDV